jgi:hypothetical protein
VSHLAFVSISVSKVDLAFDDAVDVFAGVRALKSERCWLPDFVVKVPEDDFL